LKPTDLPIGHTADIDQDWLALARSLRPLLDAAGPQIDATQSLPPAVLDALFSARMFRLLLPRSQGGAELDLPTYFQVICAIAEGDASAAWSVNQSNGCALSAAYMDSGAASDVFGDPRAVLSWGFPAGACIARQVEDGWRVTGTWGFGSGNRHSSWLGGHCQIQDQQGNAIKSVSGQPAERTALIPRQDVDIAPGSWQVLGLRGTGSDTYSVKDLFVPSRYCIVPRAVGPDLLAAEEGEATHSADVDVTDPQSERREYGPLYRFSPTIVYQAGFAAVALGLGRAMLNSFISLANQKTSKSASTMLRDNAVIQEHVAVSQARLESMRIWLIDSLRRSWDGCMETGSHRFDDRINMRLAATYAIREAARVAQDVYTDAGATAIFESQPFERRLRDMHAVTQQVQGHSIHLQTAGQHYLGMKVSSRFI
jgi:indole-3-acetate monooxygenase